MLVFVIHLSIFITYIDRYMTVCIGFFQVDIDLILKNPAYVRLRCQMDHACSHEINVGL